MYSVRGSWVVRPNKRLVIKQENTPHTNHEFNMMGIVVFCRIVRALSSEFVAWKKELNLLSRTIIRIIKYALDLWFFFLHNKQQQKQILFNKTKKRLLASNCQTNKKT